MSIEIEGHILECEPDDTFTCPFCGGIGRIATFCLDGDDLYQALCDNCGTPSYFSESKQQAMDAWFHEKRL